ncbi:hypothetical protein QQ020_34515 [Fulvivirgaceae bacterium BMA12]|uniref:HD domain-containing protein n=1 Tax=Agaribacillus aureus TaxID=3051825 RepID=A0ABT8LI73_9BACT|nr:hypothetical protein [Fulvivirgaceae bacterium BMA12]
MAALLHDIGHLLVDLRIWDDLGKDNGFKVQDIETYKQLVVDALLGQFLAINR